MLINVKIICISNIISKQEALQSGGHSLDLSHGTLPPDTALEQGPQASLLVRYCGKRDSRVRQVLHLSLSCFSSFPPFTECHSLQKLFPILKFCHIKAKRGSKL